MGQGRQNRYIQSAELKNEADTHDQQTKENEPKKRSKKWKMQVIAYA